MAAKVLYRNGATAVCKSDIHGQFELEVEGCGEALYVNTAQGQEISAFPPSKPLNEYGYISDADDIVQDDLDIAEGILTAHKMSQELRKIRLNTPVEVEAQE